MLTKLIVEITSQCIHIWESSHYSVHLKLIQCYIWIICQLKKSKWNFSFQAPDNRLNILKSVLYQLHCHSLSISKQFNIWPSQPNSQYHLGGLSEVLHKSTWTFIHWSHLSVKNIFIFHFLFLYSNSFTKSQSHADITT